MLAYAYAYVKVWTGPLPCEKYAMKNEEVLFDVLHDNYCNWQGLVLSKLVVARNFAEV